MLGVKIVEDEELIKRLEEKRSRARKSAIKEFLLNAEVGKWHEVEFNINAIYRVRKKLRENEGITVKFTAIELDGKKFVKITERS